jgi:hypothetical protein
MNPQYHGILQSTEETVGPLIETDKSGLDMSYETMSYTDYCAIDVTPNTMSTTITKVDTGDGTDWATINPTSGTGDYDFRAMSSSDNFSAFPRSMTARISDDAADASTVNVSITQQAQPI